ncbi:MAG TPA: hypothetical protein VL460_02145 [Caulobacteraceae bacterium]|jgi:hypothetical protein|nr:hypothetical protein [Caulobacteraceae bacterium]
MKLPRSKIVRALAIGLMAAAAAGAASALAFRNGGQVEVTGGFTDSLFAAGRQVVLDLTSSDDVFAAGRSIQARQIHADHLFAGAASFGFAAGQVHDAIVAAGEARFEGGRIEDDLVAAAGTLRLGPAFGVGGSAVLTGGDIEVQAPVGGELSVSGKIVRIDGIVTGSADLTAQRLVIGPNARIGGDLVYSGGTVDISPEAVVTGRRVARPDGASKAPHGLVAGAVAAAAMAFLVFVVGGAVLVLAAASAFPSLMERSAGRLETRPAASVGIGFLLLLIGPAVVGLLFVSLVGLPLGLLVAALYLAAAPLALATTVYWLGMKARRAAARGRPLEPASGWARLGWSLLAVLALLVLGAIPLAGGVVWAVAFIVGLGAVAVEGRRALAHG